MVFGLIGLDEFRHGGAEPFDPSCLGGFGAVLGQGLPLAGADHADAGLAQFGELGLRRRHQQGDHLGRDLFFIKLPGQGGGIGEVAAAHDGIHPGGILLMKGAKSVVPLS